MADDVKYFFKVSDFLRDGGYRVKESGEFVEAKPNARKLFGIPQEPEDLSKYSIKDYYVSNEERAQRIERLKAAEGRPVPNVLALRIGSENKLLFDLCWIEEGEDGETTIVGLVTNIEERVVFPKMFDDLPIGFFELDENYKIVRLNKKAVKVLGGEKDADLIDKPIESFFDDSEELKKFSQKVRDERFADEIVKLKESEKKFIELECFTRKIDTIKVRWGFIHDLPKYERFFRGHFDDLPTAYFYIEYNDIVKHRGKIKDCNKKFAQLLGYSYKEDVIGQELADYHYSKSEGEKYFKELEAADKIGKPVLNYPFRLKQRGSDKVSHIELDAHLVKENGLVIGREGTIRDLTEEFELKQKVKDAERHLEKMTADINSLIHTFLHPVIKFAGNAELLHQVGAVLHQTIQPKTFTGEVGDSDFNAKAFGKMLLSKLQEIENSFPDIHHLEAVVAAKAQPSEEELTGVLRVSKLKEQISQIINVFDYSLKEEKSDILMARAVRDTALWTLEELNKAKYFEDPELKKLVKPDFIEFLQGILFKYIATGTKQLVGETEIMKREVEALRSYFGIRKEKKYTFVNYDLGVIIENALEMFKPLLLEEKIEIDYKKSGNLTAWISSSDIDRVICNLLQNVKKYSYGRKGRYVKVVIRELQPQHKVEFYIESFGLPIRQEEIDSGDIFGFGIRSELALNSDRDGTGVGLADAKRVINGHGGEIKITSKPAYDDGNPRQYKVPYITRVTVRLPKPDKKNKE